MSKAKVTLYGLARWCNDKGSDLFSDMLLPEGIDKDILCNNILFRGSEYEVMYPDPDFMKVQIGYWSRRNYRTFNKWIEALNIPYEPLYNLDVYEEWTDTGSTAGITSGTLSDIIMRNASTSLIGGYDRTDGYTRTGSTASVTGTDMSESIDEDITDTNDLKSETSGDTTTENTRSAFDTNTYQPHDKQVVDVGSTTEDTGTVKRDRTQETGTEGTVSTDGASLERNDGMQTDTHNESTQQAGREVREGSNGSSTSGSSESTHTGHRYGNQGITMSQQMLEAELDISKWNIYEHITDLFLRDFVIPIFE